MMDYDSRWDEDHRTDDEKAADETQALVWHWNDHTTGDDFDRGDSCEHCYAEADVRLHGVESWTGAEMFYEAEAARLETWL